MAAAFGEPVPGAPEFVAPGFGAVAAVESSESEEGEGMKSDMGSPCLSHTASASSVRPTDTSQRGDSGSATMMSGTRNSSGDAPMRNRPRQPMASRSRMASTDAITPPAGMPE